MNNSARKGAVVRKKRGRGRPQLNVKLDILKFLKKCKLPVSTTDLSNNLGKAWHTIDRACLMLQIENKVDGFKVGKMNLWRIK